jgi:hypothetical protein
MRVYLGKQRNRCYTHTWNGTGTGSEIWHKIFMDNYFTSPKLFIDLHQRKINAYGTVHHNRKEMPSNFSPKHL